MRDKTLEPLQKKFILSLISLGLSLQEGQAFNETFAAADSERQHAMLSLLATLESYVHMWTSAQRTTEITQSVLDHARTDEQKAPVQVKELIESSLTLLRKKSKALGVTTQIQTDPGSVLLVNKSELNQVLLNLIKNALEAFEGSQIPVGDRILSIRHFTEGGSQVLVIQDNAGGIPADVLGRIFERRFSTKGEKGNGLGLYMAQKLVLRNAGTLSVTSRDGKTCFTLTFPPAHAMSKAG